MKCWKNMTTLVPQTLVILKTTDGKDEEIIDRKITTTAPTTALTTVTTATKTLGNHPAKGALDNIKMEINRTIGSLNKIRE